MKALKLHERFQQGARCSSTGCSVDPKEGPDESMSIFFCSCIQIASSPEAGDTPRGFLKRDFWLTRLSNCFLPAVGSRSGWGQLGYPKPTLAIGIGKSGSLLFRQPLIGRRGQLVLSGRTRAGARRHGGRTGWLLLVGLGLLAMMLTPLQAAIVFTGNVEPANPSQWSSSTTGYIGRTSNGSAEVNAGSQLSSWDGYLGYNSGVTGTATITGTGSSWTSYALYVGYYGPGTLRVEQGGQVSTAAGYLGYWSGSSGTGTVTGSGSTWSNSALYVGYSGTGNLTVTQAGQVASNTGYIGYSASTSQGTVTVTGAGSIWNNCGAVYVGYSGAGTLNVQQGGLVSNADGYLGYNSGSQGSATVSGSGSKWMNANLYVGYNGTGTLTVSDGGLVEAKTIFLTSLSNLYGNATIRANGLVTDGTVQVNTPGAQQSIPFGSGGTLQLNLDGTGLLGVGYKTTGSLAISNGALVSTQSGYLGYFAGTQGTATVSGSGSKWTNSSAIYVGYNGAGTLSVQQGAQVSNSTGYLGYNAGSQGTATVTGSGSRWVNTHLYVGYQGTGSLSVSDGAVVQTRTLFASLGNLSGNGTIQAKGVILDADVRFDSTHGLQQNITFGSLGTLALNVDGTGHLGAGYKATGTLTITDAKVVPAQIGYLGYWPNAEGTAVVSGPGSKWTLSSNLYVGYEGVGKLNISGGQVTDAYGTIGYGSSSQGTVSVIGDSAKWANSTGLSVGYKGTGLLQIINGGQVISGTGYIGHYAGSQGTVQLTGSGSTWSNAGILYIGRAGNGTLNIEQTTQVSNTVAYVGYYSGVTGNVTVTGTSANWTCSSTLYGAYQGTANISILQGGTVNDPFGLLGYLAGSQGTATVSGTGSRWNHSVGLAVGYYGKGTLLVQQGGQVSTVAGYVGYYGGSQGTATLTGSGSKWSNTGTLFFVGRAGVGTLTIQQGGQLEHAGKSYLGFYSGSSGKVTVAGAGSLWNNTDAVYVGHVASGTVDIRDGGRVVSSHAILGYASAGQGTLTLSGTGSAWTIGSSGYLLAGYDGLATIKIRSGAQLSSPTGFLGYGSRSKATALVAGSGSVWTNSSALYVGRSGSATLYLRSGGEVAAQSVSVNNKSLLSVDVGYGSLLRVGGGTGNLSNQGTVRILAGAAPPAGNQYSPIAVGTWTGTSSVQAVGGTWNPTSRQFTVSAVQTGTSGSPVQIDLAQQQRVVVNDSATGWQVGASFLASSSSKPLTITATAISGPVRSALENLLGAGETLLGGWLFTTTGSFALSDPAYLSFRVESGWTEDRLQVWQYQSASGWSRIDPADFNHVDMYSNFETTLGTLNGYGYAISGLSAAGGPLMADGSDTPSTATVPLAPASGASGAQPLHHLLALPLATTHGLSTLRTPASETDLDQPESSSPEVKETGAGAADELLLPDPLQIVSDCQELAKAVGVGLEESSQWTTDSSHPYWLCSTAETSEQFNLLQSAPEPSSWLLLVLAALGAGSYRFLRKRT